MSARRFGNCCLLFDFGDNRHFYGRYYRDLFNLIYQERSHHQEGITGACGVSRLVFVWRFLAASPSRIF